MYTRGRCTLVHISFAVLADVSWPALAEITVSVISACTFMLAWCTGTLVDVFLAVFTAPAFDTCTEVLVDKVCAPRPVLAWYRPALIKVHLALKASPSGRASTVKRRHILVADAAVNARC